MGCGYVQNGNVGVWFSKLPIYFCQGFAWFALIRKMDTSSYGKRHHLHFGISHPVWLGISYFTPMCQRSMHAWCWWGSVASCMSYIGLYQYPTVSSLLTFLMRSHRLLISDMTLKILMRLCLSLYFILSCTYECSLVPNRQRPSLPGLTTKLRAG